MKHWIKYKGGIINLEACNSIREPQRNKSNPHWNIKLNLSVLSPCDKKHILLIYNDEKECWSKFRQIESMLCCNINFLE
jgi:hypothetical protein